VAGTIFNTVFPNQKPTRASVTRNVKDLPHIYSMELKPVETQWTDERIIDLVRQLRNDLIKDFLDERNLKEYMNMHYKMSTLSQVKIEFIKRDLKELLINPVDTNHYAPLMHHIKATDSAALTDHNEQLFYRELESVFKRYIYES
jgi:hypothetical protein